ncbi:hypothetical protein MRB53_026362 [Persea americana]|uniref:Uncharacterized protein n=1 Tax=Persea americana TaxID=3435 RepID=A0ACC2LHV7_PERAE|nr:hypothetical protein MRB53_026362 [Persea americana]
MDDIIPPGNYFQYSPSGLHSSPHNPIRPSLASLDRERLCEGKELLDMILSYQRVKVELSNQTPLPILDKSEWSATHSLFNLSIPLCSQFLQPSQNMEESLELGSDDYLLYDEPNHISLQLQQGEEIEPVCFIALDPKSNLWKLTPKVDAAAYLRGEQLSLPWIQKKFSKLPARPTTLDEIRLPYPPNHVPPQSKRYGRCLKPLTETRMY